MPAWTPDELTELRSLYADSQGDTLAALFGRNLRAQLKRPQATQAVA